MKNINKLKFLLLALISYLIVFATPVNAVSNTGQVTIKTELAKETKTYKVWQVDEEETLEKLFALENEEIDKKYQDSFQVVQGVESDAAATYSQITLTLEKNKKYYVREITADAKNVLNPLLIKLKDDEDTLVIEAKYTVPNKTGSYNFVKISSQGGNLAGAKFQVEKKVGDTYEFVKKDGQPYIVESSQDGSFKVENLNYGIYYLREIEAPSGYKLLEELVEFEITDYSHTATAKQVINEPNTPPLIEIPYTGNAVLIGVLVSSFALFMIGWFLIRSSKNEEEA